MAIAYFEPFRNAASFQNRLNSIREEQSNVSFTPAVDVYEDEHQVVLTLEAPGVKQEDLDIQVDKNTLTVRGERKFDKEKEKNFHRIERRYGSFQRSFSLPTTVDAENIQATYDAGILRLELAKKAEAKPKQIKVNAPVPQAA